jgi:hypothetical protein
LQGCTCGHEVHPNERRAEEAVEEVTKRRRGGLQGYTYGHRPEHGYEVQPNVWRTEEDGGS